MFCSKEMGEERKLRHQSLFIQKSTLDFLRDLGNNAMLSSTSIVVSNDQFHWYSMHRTMGDVLLIWWHKNLVYQSYDVCLYIPSSTHVYWWCIMRAPTLELFIKKLHYVDYRWPFSSWFWCLWLCAQIWSFLHELVSCFLRVFTPSSFMFDCNFEPKFAWTHTKGVCKPQVLRFEIHTEHKRLRFWAKNNLSNFNEPSNLSGLEVSNLDHVHVENSRGLEV